jgi:hypothetical protein
MQARSHWYLSKSGGRGITYADRNNVTKRSLQKRHRKAMRMRWESEPRPFRVTLGSYILSTGLLVAITLMLVGLAR